MADVTVPVGNEALSGYLAVPAGEGPWPGAVLLHEAWGLNEDMRDQADRFAAEGYVALVPDLYSAGPRLTCIRRAFQDLLLGRGRTHLYVEETRKWLAERPDCVGRVGVIGFCMGGGFALATAAKAGFAAAAVGYGYLPRGAAEALAGACPIVASYGGRDLSLRNAADKLDRTLTTLDVPHDVKEYPSVGHAFMTRSPTPPLAWRPFAKFVLRVGHGEAEAADAWSRVFAFFEEHVKKDAQ